MNTHLTQGYSDRGATFDDIEIVADLVNNYSNHYLSINESSAEEFRKEWQSSGFDPSTDTRLVFSPDGDLIGYAEVWVTNEIPVYPWVWLRVHPDYMDTSIGLYLLRWAEKRATKVFEKVPADARVAIRCGTADTIQDMIMLLKSFNMTQIRHYLRMQIEINELPPEPVWPDGLTLRDYDPETDAEAVYQTDVEAFRDHFGFVEETFEVGFPRFMHFLTEDETYDPSLWFLAMDKERVVGICLGSKFTLEDPESGYIKVLAVKRGWRRRGIALALLQHSFREYFRRGKRKVMLGVDGKNLTGALRLYEKAGMRVLRRFDLYEKELRSGKELSTVRLVE